MQANSLPQQARLFLRSCGLKVSGLKLETEAADRISFAVKDNAEYDGVSQIQAVWHTLGRMPFVDLSKSKDTRAYRWTFEEGQILELRSKFDQGSADYCFSAHLYNHVPAHERLL